MTYRHDILLALAQADGQAWKSIADATEHTAEMMYGKQADAVEVLLDASEVEQQRLMGQAIAAKVAVDYPSAAARLTEFEIHEDGRDQDEARRSIRTDWWKKDDGSWYAEAGIDMDDQRLVAHASNADRDQIVADLRALAVAVSQLADEISGEQNCSPAALIDTIDGTLAPADVWWQQIAADGTITGLIAATAPEGPLMTAEHAGRALAEDDYDQGVADGMTWRPREGEAAIAEMREQKASDA